MYFSNIADKDLKYFHGIQVPNFTIKLTDALVSDLFKVETIISDKLYKIYPLFYTGKITSSNPMDKVIDDKVIIANNTTSTTYLTFISDENEEIQDYVEYGSYFDIGDSLTDAEYNSIVQLLRANHKAYDNLEIRQGTINGEYGDYTFKITGDTITDQGIIVTNETLTDIGSVKLTNPVFNSSTYTLHLRVFHIVDVNIDDDNQGNVIVEDVTIELKKNKEIPILLEISEDYTYIIGFGASVEVSHNQPVIKDWITDIILTGDKEIIKSGEKVSLTATCTDSYNNPIPGKTVYFYEEYEPTLLRLTGDKRIIKSSEVVGLSATLSDTDGSRIPGETVYFYVDASVTPPTPTPGEPASISLTSDKSVLSYYDSESATLTATVLDDEDTPVSGATVSIKVYDSTGTTLKETLTVTDVGDGTYTAVYDSSGVGDISIVAECRNLQETYSIEDCINYDSLTSASGKWTIPSGVTSQYSSDGWQLSANAYKQIKLTEKLTSACSVEFTLVDYSTPSGRNAPVIVYAYTNGETTPNQHILSNPSSTSFNVCDTTINRALVKGGVYRIEYTSSTIKVYENGTLLGSASNNVGLPTRFEFHQGAGGRYAIYKDLKIKPL